MKNLKKIHKISELASQYDALFFDVWGVLVLEAGDDVRVGEYILAEINDLIAKKPVYFVSNYSNGSEMLLNTLHSCGVNAKAGSVIVAGDLAKDLLTDQALLKEFFPHKLKSREEITFYHLGETDDCQLPEDLGLKCSDDVEDADMLIISLGVSHPMQCDERIFQALEKAAKKGLPALCVNPDKHFACRVSGDTYCAGYFATIYESMGGEVHFVGKPYKEIFLYALKKANLNLADHKVLMVGDTLRTDILGGNQANLDTGLVTTGNAALGLNASSRDDKLVLSQLLLYCQLHNVYPKYIVRF
jgi:HAD superfamily hydrolase (TIGR01459 family)